VLDFGLVKEVRGSNLGETFYLFDSIDDKLTAKPFLKAPLIEARLPQFYNADEFEHVVPEIRQVNPSF